MGPRRRAREHALQILFSLDGEERPQLARVLAHFWREFVTSDGAAADRDGDDARDPQVVGFAEALVTGTLEHLAEIDAVLQKASRNWRLERMARVDRNVLRLATYELKYEPEVPAKVVINEAIEVAKRFGAHESAAFVNGLLDRISQELRRP
jgi:N utilization substance protein B